jgi:outer membrane protein OmpA-like peptidoglycan-associated protein
VKVSFFIFLIISTVCIPAFSQVYILEKLPSTINSQYDEITPVPSRDGKVLYFTRVGYPVFDRTLFLDTVDYAQTLDFEKYRNFLAEIYSEIGGRTVYEPERSAFNQDVWIAGGDSAMFNAVYHPGPPLNNALPNSLVSITPDPNAFYIINQFAPAGDMKEGFSIIRFRPDSSFWEFPVPVEIQDFYTLTSDVSLTMSIDGQILILAATRRDSRDMDLYVCFREGNHRWSAPQHLGNVVNSEKRETAPFLSEDNTTLYFSSNRHSGGSDIFSTTRLDSTWKNWTYPQRLAAPINSDADDSQPFFNMSTGYIYFTSKRDGNSDIFRVRIALPQPTELEIVGRIINRKTGKLMPLSSVHYGPLDNPKSTLQTTDGTFKMKIPKGVKFELTPEMPAFIGKPEEVVYPRDYAFFREQYIDLYLDPIAVDAKIELRPIHFQQSKAIILEKSFDELERLASVLRENPNISIRIEGHTDKIGKAVDLQRLSEERAAAIRDFLLGKGIAKTRMEIVGHGPKFPVNDNSTEELRQLNRRVEVRITKI